MRFLFHLLVILLPAAVLAAESITLESGEQISFERFDGASDTRILLFPADEGYVDNELAFAEALSTQGFEVIYPLLHESYFLTTGAFSLSAVPITDIVDFIRKIDTPGRQLFIVANQRVSVVALEAALQYQRVRPEKIPGGLVLLSPYLEAEAPDAGEGMRFHPVTSRSNLPIYVFQPKSSSRYFYLEELATTLREGGSEVFTHVLADTRDSYHIWPGEIEPNEVKERALLPRRIRGAVNLIRGVAAAPLEAETGYEPTRPESKRVALPQPVAGNPPAPAIAFADMEGQWWRSDNLKGKVVLLNFWATWCPPCVEELPALQRLHDKMSGTDFAVVGIDVGEDKEAIEHFLTKNQIGLKYPILLDTDGATVKQWNITGFPTSFLLDRSGRIRYGLIGAIEWDGEQVVDMIEPLLKE